jgi:hypothetical protein
MAAFLLLAAGCTKAPDGRPKLVPVVGKVLYNKAPIEGATVVFIPEGHNYAATARTDAGGTFKLRTFAESDGAVPGNYKITVRKFEILFPPGGGEIEKQLLPAAYCDVTKSGLTATVTDGGAKDIAFDLHD